MAHAKDLARRPVAARGAVWVARAASALAGAGVRPNTISVTGVLFSAVGCVALVGSPRVGPLPRAGLYLVGALTIAGRGLCNLLDGMVAVEHGQKTPVGTLYNEIPDRVSDVLLLIGVGYAIPSFPWGAGLGWFAAVTAVMTAYVRLLGGAAGVSQPFCGPMGKPQRLALMAVILLLAAAVSGLGWQELTLAAGLWCVAAGGVATVARRTRVIARELQGP